MFTELQSQPLTWGAGRDIYLPLPQNLCSESCLSKPSLLDSDASGCSEQSEERGWQGGWCLHHPGIFLFLSDLSSVSYGLQDCKASQGCTTWTISWLASCHQSSKVSVSFKLSLLYHDLLLLFKVVSLELINFSWVEHSSLENGGRQENWQSYPTVWLTGSQVTPRQATAPRRGPSPASVMTFRSRIQAAGQWKLLFAVAITAYVILGGRGLWLLFVSGASWVLWVVSSEFCLSAEK